MPNAKQKMEKLTLIVGIVLSFGLSARAGVLNGPVTNTVNGHLYYLLAEDTWGKILTADYADNRRWENRGAG